MPIVISLFNNKGGVGKTTFLYHLAYRLAELNKNVLMVDCDSQSNLTAYALSETRINQAWAPDGNSIFRQLELVNRMIGDIYNRMPTKVSDNLHLVPGDLSLSEFEDRLGDSWNGAKGGNEGALRAQSAIYRIVLQSIEKSNAEIVLLDLGPNLGAINRAVLAGSDYIIAPLSPDLFSIRGTENLGNKLVSWRKDWDQINAAWAGGDFKIPTGRPKFMGYITQQHNLRNNSAGMTKGWQLFGSQIDGAITNNIVGKLTPLGQVLTTTDGTFNLGMIPNLHSLIPYSLEARKPVFNCTSSDGLNGAHISTARDSRRLFDPIAQTIAAMA